MLKQSLGACALVLAQFAPQVVHASDWGCKVLVCLSDKRGPETEMACVPPIQDLWKELAKPHPHFPECDTAGNSRAQMGYSWYDPCPQGTTALNQGSYAIQGTQADWERYGALNMWKRGTVFASAQVYYGIGEDALASALATRWGQQRENKVCVGNAIGPVSRVVVDANNRNGTIASVMIYDKVVEVPPAVSPRLINIYIDNSIWHTVRY